MQLQAGNRYKAFSAALPFAALFAICGLGNIAHAQTTFTTANAYGSASAPSCSGVKGASFTLSGNGGSPGSKSTTDNFGFCSETYSGNFTLTARFVSLSSGTKMAGIALRVDNTDASAANEAAYLAYDTSSHHHRRHLSTSVRRRHEHQLAARHRQRHHTADSTARYDVPIGRDSLLAADHALWRCDQHPVLTRQGRRPAGMARLDEQRGHHRPGNAAFHRFCDCGFQRKCRGR